MYRQYNFQNVSYQTWNVGYVLHCFPGIFEETREQYEQKQKQNKKKMEDRSSLWNSVENHCSASAFLKTIFCLSGAGIAQSV
jgi:hypothetical protein